MLVAAAITLACLASTLRSLSEHVDNEYLRYLEPDPEFAANEPNRQPRQVRSGHFVPVKPTPLPRPALVIVSAEVCKLLQLDVADTASADFLSLFSGGDVSASLPGFSASWATPYALSIYGQEIVPNGAGSKGDGYGDGRAISIGEVAIQSKSAGPPLRYELQLKGAGKTPFCRGADGRAVLRSSTREFLASEAMAALGVPTTRALSLVVSHAETVHRPWYRNASAEIAIGVHTPVKHGGDLTRAEKVAITTRVSHSFLRVGQFELYGRRAKKGDQAARAQLEQLTRHALRREYPDHQSWAMDSGDGSVPAPERGAGSLQVQVLGMAREAVERFAFLAAEWLRVGYTQSNFNADNNLIGGATVGKRRPVITDSLARTRALSLPLAVCPISHPHATFSLCSGLTSLLATQTTGRLVSLRSLTPIGRCGLAAASISPLPTSHRRQVSTYACGSARSSRCLMRGEWASCGRLARATVPRQIMLSAACGQGSLGCHRRRRVTSPPSNGAHALYSLLVILPIGPSSGAS